MKISCNTQSSLDRAYVCVKCVLIVVFLYPEIKSKPFQVSLRFIEVLELVSDNLLCESMRNIVFDSQVCMSNN